MKTRQGGTEKRRSRRRRYVSRWESGGGAGSILGNQIVVHGGAVSESLTINPRGVGPLNNKHGDRGACSQAATTRCARARRTISFLTLSGWSRPHTAPDTRPPRGGVTVGRPRLSLSGSNLNPRAEQPPADAPPPPTPYATAPATALRVTPPRLLPADELSSETRGISQTRTGYVTRIIHTQQSDFYAALTVFSPFFLSVRGASDPVHTRHWLHATRVHVPKRI